MENLLVEEAAGKISWQEFERLVSDILKENGFAVRKNFRFKSDRRYEIDLIAVRNNLVLCIDCKQWKQGRPKKHGLVKAVGQQEDRLKNFVEFLKQDRKLQKELYVKPSDSMFQSLIVTLLQEDIVEENETFVVPLYALNSFILEVEKYL